MSINEMLSAIEKFEGILDTYNQAWKKQYDELIKGLSETYKLMKVLEKENEELNNEISDLNNQLTGLKTKPSRGLTGVPTITTIVHRIQKLGSLMMRGAMILINIL